jgi:phage terminase large subunit-like protein
MATTGRSGLNEDWWLGLRWRKSARAEPVAAAFEAGRCLFAGGFAELEDELTALTPGGYSGSGSPDRADAMVWALAELVVNVRAEPRVRGL